jgi:hypothetical protein
MLWWDRLRSCVPLIRTVPRTVNIWSVRADTRERFVYTPYMSHRSGSSTSFSAEGRRTFYEGHRSLALFMILVVFAAPIAGLYVAGLFGAVVGVLVSAAAYVLIPYLWNWLGK